MGTLGKSLESVEKKEKQQFIDNVPSVIIGHRAWEMLAPQQPGTHRSFQPACPALALMPQQCLTL